MYTILMIVQVVVSVFLMLFVLTQQRGAGLGTAFGGSGGFYASKRGVEKFLHNGTIVLAVLFLLNSLAFLFI